jgi:small subunit ribosomal protein S8
MVDPIADMLNRIRNAQAVLKETVEIPYSNFKYEVAQILEKNGFVGKVDKKGKKAKRFFDIILKYDNKVPAILGLKRISKPGQRIYLDFQKIRRVRGGFGIAIVSTSKGLMTDKGARKEKVGGEVICEIW